MHWRGDDADDDGGDDDDDYDDDDVYGHVGSRCLALDHDFMDKLLLCPPTSLLTTFNLLS